MRDIQNNLCSDLKETTRNITCKEIISNRKQDSQRNNCHKPDKDISNVPVIQDTKCIRSQQNLVNLHTSHSISDEPSVTGAK